MNWPGLLLLAGTITVAWAADVDSSALLARVQPKIVDNERRVPRYICRQEMERQDYAIIGKGSSMGACGTLDEQQARTRPPYRLMSSDRAKLDVMLAGEKEMFSWPGGRSFDTDNPADLLSGGLSGSGDFANFTISIFTTDQTTFENQGPCQGPSCVRYSYDLPLEVSHYSVKDSLGETTLGFHGTFDVDPQTADLLQLTVIPTDLQQARATACDLRTKMTYTRTTMNTGDFTIPKSTEREFLARDGAYAVNRVSYEGCREYAAESVLSFDVDPAGTAPNAQVKVAPRLPTQGSELRLRLASKIDSEVNFAGDSLEATLDHPVRAAGGGTIQAGTIFRGHLAELGKVYFPRRQVVVAIRFDAMVANGTPIPVMLDPVGKMDRRGREVFRFPGARWVAGKEFVSRWQVR